MPFWHSVRNAYGLAKDVAKKKRGKPLWYFLLIFFGLYKKDDGLPTPTPNSSEEGKRRSSSNSSSAYSILQKWKTFRRKESVVSSVSAQSTEGEGQGKEEALENKPKIVTYPIRRMIRFTNFVATLVACLLPIVAIVVLAKLHTQAKILGFIALFTAVFAVGIMWLTDSSAARTEVFTATAA
jgi:hypothetical protein